MSFLVPGATRPGVEPGEAGARELRGTGAQNPIFHPVTTQYSVYSHNIPSASWGLELHLFLKTPGPITLLYADQLEGPWLRDFTVKSALKGSWGAHSISLRW